MKSIKHCPITYELISSSERYSSKGLKKLSSKLKSLKDFPYSAEQQRMEARQRAHKISIQGVQPKLSARLNVRKEMFTICEVGGNYILKPQHDYYPNLPENEELSMRLAKQIGIEVPLHGLLYSKDGSFTYFIKRFDRMRRSEKVAVEDFAQLSGLKRDTKYNSSMEKVAQIIEKYCTFPLIEKNKLFTRVLFNYLIGNEDMHLKNFSLITRDNNITLAPAYDFINTTLAMRKAQEEIALPLHGKKHNLTKKDFIDYYGSKTLKLNEVTISQVLEKIKTTFPFWESLINCSFLPSSSKESYKDLISARMNVLNI